MKRFIILIIILLLTVLFIPLKTYAYSKSQLDVPITDLNNHTLREVFEGENRVKSVGKNLFDKGLPNYRSGGYYSITTGAWTNDSNYDALTAIQVKPSTVYIWSVSSNRNKIYFDENENFISGTASASFTTPSNAKYVVISRNIASDSLNTLQLEQGTVATTYEPYISSENDDLPPFVYWYGLDYFELDLTVSQMDYWYSVYQFNKEHEVILSNEGLGTDLMNLFKGFINTLISLFDYIMYTKVTILGIEFSFLGLIGSGLIILILAFQIIWLVI